MSDRDAKRAGLYALARRGELGMTQEQVARAAKVDPKTINSLEHGERWPWARNVARIEAALNWPPLTLEKIAAGEEPPGGAQVAGAGERERDDPRVVALLAALTKFERDVMTDPAFSPGERDAIIAAHRAANGEELLRELRSERRERREATGR